MNSGKYIFSQILDFLPMYDFKMCIDRYKGNFNVRTFTCFDQFICMAFAQLTYRDSLRDIEVCLRSMEKKLYHIGIRGKVSRSTLAEANENRDWRIYLESEVKFLEALWLKQMKIEIGVFTAISPIFSLIMQENYMPTTALVLTLRKPFML